MKSLLIVLSFCMSMVSFAMEIPAKSSKGFDKISNSEVTDCVYVFDRDATDLETWVVGVNSKSGPYNNVLARIPEPKLPLQEGFTHKERYELSYSGGMLNAYRVKDGEGAANETIEMTLEVSPDLKEIKSAKVKKSEGFFFKNVIAEMECQF